MFVVSGFCNTNHYPFNENTSSISLFWSYFSLLFLFMFLTHPCVFLCSTAVSYCKLYTTFFTAVPLIFNYYCHLVISKFSRNKPVFVETRAFSLDMSSPSPFLPLVFQCDHYFSLYKIMFSTLFSKVLS